MKSHISDSEKLNVEQFICNSHNHEKLYNEKNATSKIQTDPNYFFQIC